MAETNLNTAADTDLGYGQLFAVLIRRRFWLLSVLCIVVAVSTVKALTDKPTYESSLQLLIEPNYQGKEERADSDRADKQFADSNVTIDNATQLKLMKSSQLIQRAVELLKPDYPDITIDEIKLYLTVSQIVDKEASTETKIFKVTYTAANPTKTQKVLKAMQQVYLDYNREQQKLRLTKGLVFINEQLPKVRQSVAQAEAALEEFRISQNLIEPGEQAKTVAVAIDNIEQERRTNQAQRSELQAQYNLLQQKLTSSPQEALVSARLSQSTRYQTLLNEIQKTDLAIAQQRIRFTDDNPVIQKLLLQRNEQMSLLQAEGQRSVEENSAQLNSTGESLLKEGQLSVTDINITTKLLEIQTNLQGLTARDQALAKKEQQLRAELDRFPNLLAKYNRLQPDIELKRATLQQLEKARQELSLEIARGGFDWQVVEAPQMGLKTGPKTQQAILLGIVIGLFMGGVAAFVREMFDDSIHSSDDLKKQLSLPLLGMTPDLSLSKKSQPITKLPFGKLQASEDWMSKPIIKLPFGQPQDLAPWTIEVIHSPPDWESLDLIYRNIQLHNGASNLNSLMITSTLEGEGKSIIALGLAISAVRLHQRVLLIDADLRQPSLHQQLNLPNEYGLSNLLESDAPLPAYSSIRSSDSYIDILTSGPIPTDPVHLLSSPRMNKLMAIFEQTYDLVLLNGSPVLGTVDALLAASCCQGVVIAARIGQVTKTTLADAMAMLNKVNMIGVIANGGINPQKNYAAYAQKDEAAN